MTNTMRVYKKENNKYFFRVEADGQTSKTFVCPKKRTKLQAALEDMGYYSHILNILENTEDICVEGKEIRLSLVYRFEDGEIGGEDEAIIPKKRFRRLLDEKLAERVRSEKKFRYDMWRMLEGSGLEVKPAPVRPTRGEAE